MKQELEQKVQDARKALSDAIAALAEFNAKPENNMFESMEVAHSTIYSKLMMEAEEDCEGSYNCGAEQYTQDFVVDGVMYVGILDCEYNRHDKMYYYIDGHEFRIEPK